MSEPNKAKTARRVIEVLEYFDEEHREVTVMDIVRRYNRPQSSTSELLASLVDMGILYKDPSTRSYTLTPRAAILGSLSQPESIRDGRLGRVFDQLSAQTGLGIALVGMIGLNAQLFRWRGGAMRIGSTKRLQGGQQQSLHESAAGWLLMSTIAPERRDGTLRRLNAEASADRKFNHAELSDRVAECARRGYAVGPAGFGTSATMCAILLPGHGHERPLVIGLAYEPAEGIEPDALVALLQRSTLRCSETAQERRDVIQLVPDAA